MRSHGTALIEVGQFAELAAAVTRQLPHDIDSGTAQGWIENQEALQRVLREALMPSEATPARPEFEVWKTIKLGTGLKSADDFRRALKESGCHISDWADDILGSPTFTAAAEETELDLVVVSVAELGFKEGARCRDIFNRAKELGLELCPAEVGPQLRLQYKGQPTGEWLLIGMEPITDSDGDLGVFYIARDGPGFWLFSGDGNPAYFWHGPDRWVFVCPRK